VGPVHPGGTHPGDPGGPIGPVGPVHPGGTHPGDPGGPLGPIGPIDPDGPVIVGTDPIDSRSARAFRTAAREHLNAFFPFEPRQPTTRTDFTAIGLVVVEALKLTVPGPAIHAGIRVLVDLKGQDRPDEKLLEPVSLAPKFPQPMWAPLSELGQDLMLPGLEGIPANTVVPLVTNSPFVEAYLVGLNAELGRELLWREFPAPPLSTYFRQFWDTSVAPGQDPDIPVLQDWGDRALGGAAAEGEERFVMLLRSELLRRYPHAIIYAVDPATNPPTESYPMFTGAMDPDVRFFGFELSAGQMRKRSLVIQEQPSAPRFGIEVADDPGDASHLAVTDTNSAAVAKRLRQLPVRLAIPATVLLGKD
jgi:hypothetical protein